MSREKWLEMWKMAESCGVTKATFVKNNGECPEAEKKEIAYPDGVESLNGKTMEDVRNMTEGALARSLIVALRGDYKGCHVVYSGLNAFLKDQLGLSTKEERIEFWDEAKKQKAAKTAGGDSKGPRAYLWEDSVPSTDKGKSVAKSLGLKL